VRPGFVRKRNLATVDQNVGSYKYTVQLIPLLVRTSTAALVELGEGLYYSTLEYLPY